MESRDRGGTYGAAFLFVCDQRFYYSKMDRKIIKISLLFIFNTSKRKCVMSINGRLN